LLLYHLEGDAPNLPHGGFESTRMKEGVLYIGYTTFGLYIFLCSCEPDYLAESSKELCSIYARTDKAHARIVLVLAVLLLVSGGITHRPLASHAKLVIDIPIALPASLSSLSTRMGDCLGNHLSVRTTTRDFMQKHSTNDFLRRQHTNAANGVLK